jgi:predicted short-subunit dehydrogenase-like oxidoreductase (DUF2520 family)
MVMKSYRVSFAGAGKVAGALCKAMHRSGFNIQQIVSQNESNGRLLSNFCNARWSADLIFSDLTDIIIVAVPDHVLKNVLNNIKCGKETLVVHTAGSMGLDVFPIQISRTGVLYPLQTFSRERELVFKDLPFFLEASDSMSETILNTITESVGGRAYYADSEQRILVHLAAVFINNFTNHMFTIGNELILRSGFSFEVFEQLIKETISKALEMGPHNAQTGPASRNDLNTIEKHMNLLSFSPEMQCVYREITRSIIKYNNRFNS